LEIGGRKRFTGRNRQILKNGKWKMSDFSVFHFPFSVSFVLSTVASKRIICENFYTKVVLTGDSSHSEIRT
jgi:hypothetical protein